ncbi:MAG: L-arabinose isomerase, partial [Bacteroidota bacterium]
MKKVNNKEIWFITGSQHLYGTEVLKQVAQHSETIVKGLNEDANLLVSLKYKDVVKTPDEILQTCIAANADEKCIGVVVWMHTFSPAKMWIRGLSSLRKPLCHLHTQFNAEIPWASIDMDFMNLNQAAHGDREFGHIMSRMRKKRKIVVGHWQSQSVQQKLAVWSRVAMGWHELQTLKLARIGDNMREVAVTEGDKVEAQIRFGFSVNGYDTTDVLKHLTGATSGEVAALLATYESEYNLTASLKTGGEKRESLVEAARIELALRSFLEGGGFGAFTDTFENLGEFKQLPGIAVQRLMMDGELWENVSQVNF